MQMVRPLSVRRVFQFSASFVEFPNTYLQNGEIEIFI